MLRHVEPELFDAFGDDARSLGFTVASGPLVRSSYRAAALAREARRRVVSSG